MQLSQLIPFEKYGLKHLQGPLDREVFEVLPPEKCRETSLVFVSKAAMIESALTNKVTSFIKVPDLKFNFPAETTVFEVPSISLGLALVLPLFDKKLQRFESSPTAYVHPTAKIGPDVILGPFSVIGANSIIGRDCRIGAHAVVENNCVVGAGTVLHPQVFVGSHTEIGIKCEIHSHTTIGSDGFGYITNSEDGRHHKIPQLGRVIIEDNVEIGANCAIDRATLAETRIKSGTKIDNLVHIAHNCEVGENGLITAGFMMAGSSKIGKQFMAGGQSGVSDHMTIVDNVTLAGRTAVLSNITEPGTYGGSPVVKAQHYLRISRALIDLPDMWKWWRKNTKGKTQD